MAATESPPSVPDAKLAFPINDGLMFGIDADNLRRVKPEWPESPHCGHSERILLLQ